MRGENIVITEKDADRLRNLVRRGTEAGENGKDQLKRLAEELMRAQIVDSRVIPPDVVTMNSLVKFRDIDNRETYAYSIVYPEFADTGKNRISVLAPVGMALLGCRVGDVLEWPVPAGIRRLKIEDVVFQPEAAGRYEM